jgi:hypothetical protein
MKKMLCCLVLAALASLPLSAQKRRAEAPKPEFRFAYFGDYLARPGVKLGVSYPVAQKIKEKTKPLNREETYVLTKTRRIELGGSFTFFHHPKDHNGLLFNAELTWHRIRNRSYKTRYRHFEAGLGLGYFRYQLLGTTFEPDGDGGFKEKNNAGGNAFMPSLFAAWGMNLRFIKSADVRAYVKPLIMVEIPYSAGVKTHFAFEAGLASTLTKNKKSRKK